MDSFPRLLDSVGKCLGRFENVVAERPMLAAVSGGVDSTVLLLALARLRDEGRLHAPLRAVHVDHGVRPDSGRNAQHVVDLCDRLDVPVTHINASYVRGHFNAMEVGVGDAPRADEMVLILVMTTGGRVHDRVGGLRASEVKGEDGLR